MTGIFKKRFVNNRNDRILSLVFIVCVSSLAQAQFWNPYFSLSRPYYTNNYRTNQFTSYTGYTANNYRNSIKRSVFDTKPIFNTNLGIRQNEIQTPKLQEPKLWNPPKPQYNRRNIIRNSRVSSRFNTRDTSVTCASKQDWRYEYSYVPTVSSMFAWPMLDTVPDYKIIKGSILSPLSIFAAMTPLIRGTIGETNDEIINAFKMKKYIARDVEIKKSRALGKYSSSTFRHNRLLKALAASGPLTATQQQKMSQVEYTLATGIYLNDGVEFIGDYGYDIRNVMLGKIRRVDMSDKIGTLNAINSFFNESTKGKIPKVIDKIEENTQLILVSALYLKARWTFPFNERLTGPGIFTKPNGDQIYASFMKNTNKQVKYNYTLLPESFGDALQLPLGPKECKTQFMFNIFRPFSYKDIEKLQKYLLDSSLLNSNYFKNQRQVIIRKLEIPKFEISSDIDLKSSLQQLGINKAFSISGNFTKMVKDSTRFSVSSAIHKAVFEIDENGIEGAAATMISITARTAMLYTDRNSIEFVLDRPFIFSVTEASTDMVLFVGRVNEPGSVK